MKHGSGEDGRGSHSVPAVVRLRKEKWEANQGLRGIGASRLTARPDVCAGHAA